MQLFCENLFIEYFKKMSNPIFEQKTLNSEYSINLVSFLKMKDFVDFWIILRKISFPDLIQMGSSFLSIYRITTQM
jgi:hypothetical protein